jgi:hypothetical protein
MVRVGSDMTTAALAPETKARVVSLLREAVEAAERLSGSPKEWARYTIGRYLRDLGLEEPFDNYGQVEIEAAEAPPRPEWDQARQKLREIEAEAQRRLKAHDFRTAREIYRSGDEQRATVFGNLSRFGDFLGWLFQDDDPDLWLAFYRSSDWKEVFWYSQSDELPARALAKALISVGLREEGIKILRERCSFQEANGDPEPLAWVGKTLWIVGERFFERGI